MALFALGKHLRTVGTLVGFLCRQMALLVCNLVSPYFEGLEAEGAPMLVAFLMDPAVDFQMMLGINFVILGSRPPGHWCCPFL